LRVSQASLCPTVGATPSFGRNCFLQDFRDFQTFHQCVVSECRITVVTLERTYEEMDGRKAIQNLDLLLKSFSCEYAACLFRLAGSL